MAVILFLVFFGDISDNLRLHVKFADDLSLWNTNTSASRAAEELTQDLKAVSNWAHLWRMGVSTAKSHVMCFCKHGHTQIKVEYNNQVLTQVKEQRALGVILDENLSFKAHTLHTTSKARSTQRKLGAFTRQVGGASAEANIFLYKACVLPHIEYCYPVWCSTTSIQSLEVAQHTSLSMALGVMNKSSTSSVQILAQVLPLDIKLDRNLIMAFINILRKPPGNCLRDLVVRLLSDESTARGIITPITKFKMASQYLLDFDTQLIEKLHTERIEDILHTPPTLESFYTGLGSAGTRSSEQKSKALKLACDRIAAADNNVVIFTDGSALGNPGPCGAGVAIHWNGISHDSSSHKKPVSSFSNSYHGELSAIDLAIEEVASASHQPRKNVLLLSDCQSALTVASSPLPPTSYSNLYYNIQRNVKQLLLLGICVTLHWIAGHVDLPGNDKSDTLAKEAAQEAENMTSSRLTIAWNEAKSRLNKNAHKRWTNRISQLTRNFHLPPPSVKSFKSSMSRIAEIRYFRLKLGHTRLKDHMNRIMPTEFPSPICDCGVDRETVEHFLLNCPLHLKQREIMIEMIVRGYITHT